MIYGNLKLTLSGTLPLTKSWSFDRSGSLVSVLVLFNTFATDAKYSFSFVAISLESVKVSFANLSSLGKVLFVEAAEVFIVGRCFQIVLVSLKFSIESEKLFRLAFLISLLVLLRYRLYSDQFLECLYLSRIFRASPISGVYIPVWKTPRLNPTLFDRSISV